MKAQAPPQGDIKLQRNKISFSLSLGRRTQHFQVSRAPGISSPKGMTQHQFQFSLLATRTVLWGYKPFSQVSLPFFLPVEGNQDTVMMLTGLIL